MANKKSKYTYRGTSQDTSKANHEPSKYFEAQHIRLLSTDTQATGALSNEKGNELVLTMPAVSIRFLDKIITYNGVEYPYTTSELRGGAARTDQETERDFDAFKIIGHTETRSGVILFTTEEDGDYDAIWEITDVLNDDYSITLLYLRKLGFSVENPIQAIFNYENQKIEKIYWVDGVNQIRFLNLRQSIDNGDAEELMDVPQSTINFVGNITLSNPEITGISNGGLHTAGMIQYTYNLYKLNGSQTSISPLTELVPLTNGSGLGGGELNEVVGAIPRIEAADLDEDYTHIKLYAIKYTSLDQSPSVSIIVDQEVSNSRILTYFDDGRIIEQISLEELLFLGSDPLIPRHIESKDNRLFMANIDENAFDVDLDCRAYGFELNSDKAVIINDPAITEGSSLPIPGATPDLGGNPSYIDTDFTVDTKHDCLNANYDYYTYQKNSSTYGATGKHIEISFTPEEELTDLESKTYKFFKDNEIYRVGIQFYNILGQVSFPKWITDFKAKDFNLETTYTFRNTLRVSLTSAFYSWIEDDDNFEDLDRDKPVGDSIIRAKRELIDRTVIHQGAVAPMMFQVKGLEAQDVENFYNSQDIVDYSEVPTNVKIPSWTWRTFEETFSNPLGTLPLHINEMAEWGWLVGNPDEDNLSSGEIWSNKPRGAKLSQTFQYNQMMQLYSPEIIFGNNESREGLKLKVRGVTAIEEGYTQGSEVDISTGLEKFGGTARYYKDSLVDYLLEIDNTYSSMFNAGVHQTYNAWICPSGSNNTVNVWQFYKKYSNFRRVINDIEYDVYGTPEIAIKGGPKRSYNGNAKYNYQNTLDNFISDGIYESDDGASIASLNSEGARCLTLMLGEEDTETEDRPSLNDIFSGAGFNAFKGYENSVVITELVIPNINIYVGNIYGGFSYEAKKRNVYSQIGEYQPISTGTVYIKSPGDTFVQDFFFQRLSKTNTGAALNNQVMQFTEIISYPIETTVDLKNRHDLSLFSWDSSFQAEYENFHLYNKVYSQTSNIILNAGEGSLFKAVDEFDTRVYTSKLKAPGEVIDNWTDLLINESLDLDGKYGPINSLINFNDELYTFQDEAIAKLSINPNILIQGSDAISIELGTGGIFHDYNYVDTNSGSINKWGVISTSKGIYYYDALNRSIGKIPNQKGVSLTDEKGLHTFFNNNYDYDTVKEDNPVLLQGPSFGYDAYNKDLYFTLHQGDQSFTRIYSEAIGEFIDLKTYLPTRVINKGDKTILVPADNTTLYEQYKGNYNIYFGEQAPSFVILMLNPESDYDCVFDTIEFKSELYLDDIDQPDKTLTHIQAYNEYQDSGKVSLIVGRDKNLRRKFREWRADIPRDGRNRIRNPWIFLKLELDNVSNSKLVLHDIIVNYTI